MAGPVLLGLILGELALGAAVALAYRRRQRRMVRLEAIDRVTELVAQASELGRRAQDPRLSLAERAALLEETRAALSQAMVVLRSSPRPLELGFPLEAPRPRLPAAVGEPGRS